MGLSDIGDLGARRSSVQPCTSEKRQEDQLQPSFRCLTSFSPFSSAPIRKLGFTERPQSLPDAQEQRRLPTWIGSRIVRRYDQPRTPLDRLKASGHAEPGRLAALLTLREQTDPFKLSQTIERKLERIFKLAKYCR